MPDLNLKKSWNPRSFKNREKVWKREQAVLEEHRKTVARDADLREIDEKGQLLALASGKKHDRTSWIYQDEAKGEANEEANEDILLGRKSLGGVVKRDAPKQSHIDKVVSLEAKEPSKADLKAMKEDPLFAIQAAQRTRVRGVGEGRVAKGGIEKRRVHHHHHKHHRKKTE